MKLLAFAILFSVSVFSGKAQISNPKTPLRILLSLTATPTESMAVTWRTKEKLETPQVQFAIASDWTDFEDSATSIEAKTEKVQTGKAEVFHYSAEIKGLIPSQQYVYRVGGDSVWNEWNHFKTAKTGSEPFQFIWFGDIQHDVKKFGSRILREAYRYSPQAEFLLFTGDVTDRAELDYQWDQFFSAAGFIPSVIPSVFVAGNHEYADTIINGKETEVLVPLWQAHINQPETNPIPYFADTNSIGYYIANRNASNLSNIWKNGVLKNTSSGASGILLNGNMLLCAYRNLYDNAIGGFSNKECAFATIGQGLNDTESYNMYLAVNKFQTSLGRNV